VTPYPSKPLDLPCPKADCQAPPQKRCLDERAKPCNPHPARVRRLEQAQKDYVRYEQWFQSAGRRA
jgi:hypothetical protein